VYGARELSFYIENVTQKFVSKKKGLGVVEVAAYGGWGPRCQTFVCSKAEHRLIASRSQCMDPTCSSSQISNCYAERKLFSRSDRVDFHPTEPWLLSGLYNGTVNIYNHETGAIVKTFKVAEVPVRCVKFIARKN
jgi:hypothetical protein